MSTHRSHDEATIEMLRDDPDMVAEYLSAALDGLSEEGGEAAFLLALRHVVEARGGFTTIADKAGLSRETLYRTLSPAGNPTIKTLGAVMRAANVSLLAR